MTVQKHKTTAVSHLVCKKNPEIIEKLRDPFLIPSYQTQRTDTSVLIFLTTTKYIYPKVEL